MWLAVDFGNTRVKWALIEEEKVGAIVSDDQNWEQALLKAARLVNEIWVSFVGDLKRREEWIQRLSEISNVNIVRSQKQLMGVLNNYQPPESLGVDRWLALLGARHYWRRKVIVISAGTAITVDALDEQGIFRGGIILPGLNLMRQSLQQSAYLPCVQDNLISQQLPDNTQDAIQVGSICASVGAIELFRRRFAATSPLLVSGGDAPHLYSFLSSAHHLPELLFIGMVQYRKAVQCINS